MAYNSHQTARKLIQLSCGPDGALDPERVAAALEWTRRFPVARRRSILRAFMRLARRALSRRLAVVEHAGPVNEDDLKQLQQTLSEKAGHDISITTRENPELIAGIRVRLGDDLLDASVAGRLDRFAAAIR